MNRDSLPEELRLALQTVDRYQQKGWKIHGSWDFPMSPEEVELEWQERQQLNQRYQWACRVIPKYAYTTKSGRVRAALARITRNKVLTPEEACKTVLLLCKRVSPGAWSQVHNASGFIYPDRKSVGVFRGVYLYGPSEREHSDAIQEAYDEGRQFTEVKQYKTMREVGMTVRRYRAIRVIKENKQLLNQLKKEIDYVQNPERRPTA